MFQEVVFNFTETFFASNVIQHFGVELLTVHPNVPSFLFQVSVMEKVKLSAKITKTMFGGNFKYFSGRGGKKGGGCEWLGVKNAFKKETNSNVKILITSLLLSSILNKQKCSH